jgi:hypothetical protein
MAIDPSIALGYKGFEAPNPLAQYAQVAQIQNAQNQNALNQYQLSAAKRADEQTNAMNELYAKHYNPATGAVNQNALYGELAAKGFGGQIPAMQAKLADVEHKNATTQKTKVEAAAEEKKFISSAIVDLSRNPSNENVAAWAQDAQLSPTLSAQAKANILKESQAILAIPVGQRKQYMSMAGASVSDITARGQLGVAQKRLEQDAQAVTYQTDGNGNIVALPTKIAPGTVAKAIPIVAPGAGMEPLKAKDASKTAVSEQQAAYNIGRILTAAKEINKVTKEDPSAIQPGAAEAGFNAVGMKGTDNATRNANRQIVSGAQRDALDAMLYLATGAAYNKEQLEGQMEAYIPQYTDKPERVASKQAAMRELINNAKVRAGKAWTPEMESAVQSLTNPTSAAAPAGGGEWSVVK